MGTGTQPCDVDRLQNVRVCNPTIERLPSGRDAARNFRTDGGHGRHRLGVYLDGELKGAFIGIRIERGCHYDVNSDIATISVEKEEIVFSVQIGGQRERCLRKGSFLRQGTRSSGESCIRKG